MRRKQAQRGLVRDLFFICIGIVIALVLSYTGSIDFIVGLFGNTIIASFVAGLFFTSAFTIAPAAVALAHIALHADSGLVALWGALGAACGDMVLFFFIRDRFADDLIDSFRPSVAKHIFASFHLGFMKWLSPILGAVVIASPLPDEFGIALMGISKVRAAVLMPIAFIMNIIGIYSVIWFAGAL